tara:strand:- start:1144 stop:1701 length:558 start_codon:yes stop_codon:yes gene_type:complete
MNYIITGLICSGKSTFLKIAKENNYMVLKSDDLVEELYNDQDFLNILKSKLDIQSFKNNPKKIIRNSFVKSENNKRIIEDLVHPIIHSLIIKELSLNKNLIIELPAIKNNKDLICNNKSVFIETNDEKRRKYYKINKSNDLEFFERVNEYQKDYLSIKSCCDIIINNNNNIDALYKFFDEVIDRS